VASRGLSIRPADARNDDSNQRLGRHFKPPFDGVANKDG
jgi:hypothetical protein